MLLAGGSHHHRHDDGDDLPQAAAAVIAALRGRDGEVRRRVPDHPRRVVRPEHARVVARAVDARRDRELLARAQRGVGRKTVRVGDQVPQARVAPDGLGDRLQRVARHHRVDARCLRRADRADPRVGEAEVFPGTVGARVAYRLAVDDQEVLGAPVLRLGKHLARHVVDERAVVLGLGGVGDGDEIAVRVVGFGVRTRLEHGGRAVHAYFLVRAVELCVGARVRVGVGGAAALDRERVAEHVAHRVVITEVDVASPAVVGTAGFPVCNALPSASNSACGPPSGPVRTTRPAAS